MGNGALALGPKLPRPSSTLPVPTIRFEILYVFLVLAHDRRRIIHFAVTAHPTAEWTAQQMREAFLGIARRDICCAIAIGSSRKTSSTK